MTGGAIYILGVTGYRVLDSVFYDNAVVPATWARTASYGLMLTTAQTGASAGSSPMWSIDDGSVFGLSLAECSTAQEASAQGIGRGLAPSWPGEAKCANDTVYQSFELYTHGLKLAEGNHILHIGVFARSEGAGKIGWPGGGKIEVVGLFDPIFPVFDDDRTTLRYPGCISYPGFSHSCPGKEAFWSDLLLHVAVGKVQRPSSPADNEVIALL